MDNKIALVREKLSLYGKRYIKKEFLDKILFKFASNYLVSDLCDKSIVTTIKRGDVYLNNKSRDPTDPFVVGGLYMGKSIYTFGGLVTYNRYGFSTQVPDWFTVYNTKISGKKEIGNSKFIFVRQRKSFFYGIKTIKNEEYEYNIFSPERAFIQLLKEGKVFESIPNSLKINKLRNMAKKYSSKSIYNKINDICL